LIFIYDLSIFRGDFPLNHLTLTDFDLISKSVFDKMRFWFKWKLYCLFQTLTIAPAPQWLNCF